MQRALVSVHYFTRRADCSRLYSYFCIPNLFATTCTLYMYIVGQRNTNIASVRLGFSNCVSVKLGSGCRVCVLRYVVVAML